MTYKLVLSFLFFTLIAGSAFSEITIKSNKPVKDERDYRERYARPVNSPSLSKSTLSPELQSQVQEIRKRYQEQTKALKPQIKDKNKQMKDLLASNTIDIQALEKLNNELFELKKQENLVKLQYQYDLSRILTAEQRQALVPGKKIKQVRNYN